MVLDDFIAKTRAGVQLAGAGLLQDGIVIETTAALDPADLDAVTAEAYNQDVFGADVPWANARAQVEAALRGAPAEKARRPTVRLVVK